MGRNILMHAARGNHADVFARARDLYKDHRHTFTKKPAEKTDDYGSFDVTAVDNTGRSVLHHAAEAGCLDVLTEVMKHTNTGMLQKPDGNGLTPVHHLLRAKYGEPEGRDELSSKFKKLWTAMEARDVMPWTSTGKKRVEIRAKTELIHAARGGFATLRLVLEKVRAAQKASDVGVDVDKTLSVSVAGDTEASPPDAAELAAWGWGMLLGAATKGGHVEVLEIVVRAIKVCTYSYTRRTWSVCHQTAYTRSRAPWPVAIKASCKYAAANECPLKNTQHGCLFEH